MTGTGRLGRPDNNAADPKNVPAFRPNGSTRDTANSKLPSGGPANVSPTVRLTWRFPLALGSCSGGTSSGSTDWAALEKNTSAEPSRNPSRISRPMSIACSRTSTAISAMISPCSTWDRHIRTARSYRSTMTPAGSDHTSHGTNSAAATSEISRGSLVTVTASSGSAATYTPAPTLLTVLAHSTRRYACPRERRTMRPTVTECCSDENVLVFR